MRNGCLFFNILCNLLLKFQRLHCRFGAWVLLSKSHSLDAVVPPSSSCLVWHWHPESLRLLLFELFITVECTGWHICMQNSHTCHSLVPFNAGLFGHCGTSDCLQSGRGLWCMLLSLVTARWEFRTCDRVWVHSRLLFCKIINSPRVTPQPQEILCSFPLAVWHFITQKELALSAFLMILFSVHSPFKWPS